MLRTNVKIKKSPRNNYHIVLELVWKQKILSEGKLSLQSFHLVINATKAHSKNFISTQRHLSLLNMFSCNTRETKK